MFRRQIINTIRRYNHEHCAKNIQQINCNNEKDLKIIFEQQKETNKTLDKIRNDLSIIFIYSIINIGVIVYFK